MPYISQDERDELNEFPRPVAGNVGELNYIITRSCVDYLDLRTADGVVHYEDINAVIGVLECAKHEFARRVLVPHEKWKKKENGDVY